MEGDPFLPGFHFHPTDVDLVQYLKRKVMGERLHFEFITEIDVYKFDPWDLPEKSVFCPSDWYFFCPRDWKYSNGSRTIRVTENGFWKPTGNDKPIFHNTRKVGNKRRLVFHMGCAPKGDITNWVMHKYSLEDKDLVDAGIFQDAYSLCRIFEKSDPGPKNGEQCGAPFRDEDWDDVANDSLDSFSLANLGSSSSRVLPDERNIPMVKATGIVDMGGSLLEPLPHQIRLSNANEVLPSLQEDDDVASLLSIFDNEDDALVSNDKDRNEKPASLNVDEGIDLDGFGIYTGLEAFNSQSELKAVDGFRFHSSLETEDAPSQNFLGDEMLFLELNDLESPVGYPPEDNSSESSDCSSLDDIYAHHNEYNNSEGFCNPLDAGLSASGVSMTHSLCPEGSQVEDQLALFLEYEDFEGDVNCGYEAANPVPYSGEEAEERGNRNVQQVMARGEEEGSASDSVLQYLLESIPARSASAAEHPSPTNGEKTSKGKSLLSPYGGSSVHVEAEVTVRCGHTRDAFSDELEKLPCMTYGRTLLRREPRKRVATRSSGFKFVFLLGMVTALFWLILLVFSVQFCRYAWNRLLS